MKDTAKTAYSAWPDRIMIVGVDGKIAYRGEQGPRGFRPGEAKDALAKILEKK